MDIGVVVQNVGTIFAIREAVVYEKPLFERGITVSGSMINKPGNYKVRLGTLISDIVEECGGLKGEPAKVVVGGPMCGTSIHTLEMPVVKGTSGILFLSEKETGKGDFFQCIRCGKCVSACCGESGGKCEGCAEACPTGAIKREKIVVVDGDKCVDCGLCIEACKYGAIKAL